ncbi:MAG: hypothetical protein AAFN77_18195 [Planctomycetota bacterium]
MNKLLVGALLVMAFFAMIWGYLDFSAASIEFESTTQKQTETSDRFLEIMYLRQCTGEAISPVAKDKDIYPTIIGCIRSSGIELPASFSIQPTRVRSLNRFGLQRWQINMPTLECTPEAFDRLVRALKKLDFDCQSISLVASNSDARLRNYQFEARFSYWLELPSGE